MRQLESFASNNLYTQRLCSYDVYIYVCVYYVAFTKMVTCQYFLFQLVDEREKKKRKKNFLKVGRSYKIVL